MPTRSRHMDTENNHDGPYGEGDGTVRIPLPGRLRDVGTLAAGIAHELGTPLNVITARAELIAARQLSPRETEASAEVIGRQAMRMAEIIQQLLDFARRSPPRRKPHDMREVARRSLDRLSRQAHDLDVGLSLEAPEVPVTADVDAGQLDQVLTILVTNGVQASPPRSAVTVTVRRRRLRPPEDPTAPREPRACLEVEDHGPGIPPGVLGRIFDPFYTTRDVGEGAGMGLAVAHGIVGEHDGWIAVETTEQGGSCFSVCLPLSEHTHPPRRSSR